MDVDPITYPGEVRSFSLNSRIKSIPDSEIFRLVDFRARRSSDFSPFRCSCQLSGIY